MRTTIMLLAIAVLAVAVLAACRVRDDGTSDTAPPDTGRSDDTATAGDTVATDSASGAASTPRNPPARSGAPVRRAADTAAGATLPDDSIRVMRPDMPQVTPEKRPRTWRGFKLPEEMPVRVPVDTIRGVEQVPDSVMKGDSTKPPKPER